MLIDHSIIYSNWLTFKKSGNFYSFTSNINIWTAIKTALTNHTAAFKEEKLKPEYFKIPVYSKASTASFIYRSGPAITEKNEQN